MQRAPGLSPLASPVAHRTETAVRTCSLCSSVVERGIAQVQAGCAAKQAGQQHAPLAAIGRRHLQLVAEAPPQGARQLIRRGHAGDLQMSDQAGFRNHSHRDLTVSASLRWLCKRVCLQPGGVPSDRVGCQGTLTTASGGEPSAAGQPSAMDLASTAARRAAAALCADAGAAGPLAAPASRTPASSLSRRHRKLWV